MNTLKLGGDWAPYNRKVAPLSFPSKLFLNLEGPIFEKGVVNSARISKAGPSLWHASFPNNCVRGIVTLANNHFFDYGLSGCEESLKVVQREQWLHIGGGLSRGQAAQPLVFDWNGKKIGVVARCEVQFGVAQENKPGVAGFDATIYEQIRKLKRETDFVIASIHAAAEMLPWPSPKRQDTWRALVDAGADIVHGHHAHVPQGWEEWRGGLIFYGLGNFCVDPAKWAWHPNGLWSLAPELTMVDECIVMSPKTTVIEDHGHTISVRESTQEEYQKHHEYFIECNRPLSDRGLLEGIWQEASILMYHDHWASWLGFDVPLNKVLYRLVLSTLRKMKHKMARESIHSTALSASQSKNLLRYHLFACESHNDAISTALGVLGGELNDLRTPQTAALCNKWMIDQ